jgi:hypothetical protein
MWLLLLVVLSQHGGALLNLEIVIGNCVVGIIFF